MKPMYSWLDVLVFWKDLPAGKVDVRSLPVVALSVALYIAACASPSILWSASGGVDRVLGVHLLTGGICGVFMLQFGWFANVWFLLAVLATFFGNWRGVRNYSIVAIILGLQALMLFNAKVCTDSPYPAYVLGFDYGYFLWLSSFLPLYFLGASRTGWAQLTRHYGMTVVNG